MFRSKFRYEDDFGDDHFTFEGVHYVAVAGNKCTKCAFGAMDDCSLLPKDVVPECRKRYRADKRDVIFVRAEIQPKKKGKKNGNDR